MFPFNLSMSFTLPTPPFLSLSLAIDQFLEHILKHEKNVVRVGGRSQSPALGNYTLYELRKAEKQMGVARIFRKRSELQKKINDLIYEMYEEPCVSLDYIRKSGTLTPRQLDSLKRLAEKQSVKKGLGQTAAQDTSLDDEWVINSEPPTMWMPTPIGEIMRLSSHHILLNYG
jgi:hypothetical protein